MKFSLVSLSLSLSILSLSVYAQSKEDLAHFIKAYSRGDLELSDFNRDGQVDSLDLHEFMNATHNLSYEKLSNISDPAEKFRELDRLYHASPELLRKYQPELYRDYLQLTQGVYSDNSNQYVDPASTTSCGFNASTSFLLGDDSGSAPGNGPQVDGDVQQFKVADRCRYCMPGANSTFGRGLVWPVTGPLNWDDYSFVEPIDTCLFNLGQYNDNGIRIGGNNNQLNGKFASTDLYTVRDIFPGYSGPDFPRVSDPENDFRVHYSGSPDPSFPATDQQAVGWSAEVNAYYHVDNYRRNFLNTNFVRGLLLDPTTEHNVLRRQYRPDLEGMTDFQRPEIELIEIVPTGTIGTHIFPFSSTVQFQFNHRWGDWASTVPMAYSYDPSLVVGEYAGLVGFWVIGDPRGFDNKVAFGQSNEWISNMSPILNDSLNYIEAMRYSGQDEVFRYSWYSNRIINGVPCDGTHVACGRGINLDNVMMFEPGNTSKNMVFPFQPLPGASDHQGPQQSELASMYIGAIFRDIGKEAGIGIYRAAQLFWRTLYLITDRDNVPMQQYGNLIIQAARDLWPSNIPAGAAQTPPGNIGNMLSIYEKDIVDVLSFRGIPTYGRSTFTEALPSSIGTFPQSLEKDSAIAFGSSHPESHPPMTMYGAYASYSNGYIHPDTNADYVAYQTWRFGAYGPCDRLELTDGTFTGSVYNNDGSYHVSLEGREVANKVILAPGNTIRWLRYRGRCANENEGDYAHDVRNFGFRTIKATTEGFGFKAHLIAALPGWNMKYQLSIVDPSYATQGGSYQWTFKDRQGNITQASGTSVNYTIKKDEPFEISITRIQNGQPETLVMQGRSTDLARDNGEAYLINLLD